VIPVRVFWEKSEFWTFPVAYATSLAKHIGVVFVPIATPGAGAGSASFLPLNTAIATELALDSDLGLGAKVSIAAGIAVIIALLLTSLVAFIRRRRLLFD
jgi:hypothetical protein